LKRAGWLMALKLQAAERRDGIYFTAAAFSPSFVVLCPLSTNLHFADFFFGWAERRVSWWTNRKDKGTEEGNGEKINPGNNEKRWKK